MTVGSLFSGIGGLDLGFERVGAKVLWQVEIDSFARQVLGRHWPDTLRYEDVADCGVHNLARVDAIIGGFPCQGFSPAGLRRGFNDARSGLWYEYLRIIREMGPDYVVVENSSAIIDRGLPAILGALSEIGFDAEWSVLPACSLGAPHTRERLFILAYAHRLVGQTGVGVLPHWEVKDAQGDCRPLPRHWVEPFGGIRGMVDGVPLRVDAIGRLGNAVVPQVAEYVARAVMAHHYGANRI